MAVSHTDQMRLFLERPLCVQASKPLSKSVCMRVLVDGETPISLRKQGSQLTAFDEPPQSPDLSFRCSSRALSNFLEHEASDLGELAVGVLKGITSSEPDKKITPEIHIGIIEFVRKGYFGLIALGGPSLMKHLAKHGMGSLSKIRTTLSQLRTEAQ